MGKKGDKKSFFKFCTGTIIVVSVLACFVSIIATQASLAEKREELQQLVNKTEEVRSQNQEYQQLFNEDINSYKEKLAIENMNYAYPNEIRFYDTSRN